MSRDRILFLSYDPEAPSFRHRFEHLMPRLEARGWRCAVSRLPKGRYGLRLLAQRGELARAEVVVLAKLRLAIGEGRLLRSLARRVVFDFDDALFVHQPRRPGERAGRSWLRRKKFALTCRCSDLVLAGNEYLATAARHWARRVEVVPTPVDLTPYQGGAPANRQGQTLVWIGRPENLCYLEPLRPVLATLHRRFPSLRLRLICSHFPDWPALPVERVGWSNESEARQIASAGIGIMPLTDDGWARGKCAFKLLQYMAAGLPCVASAVGMNREVVEDGATGYLASSPEEWSRALARLLASPERRAVVGAAARKRVEALYSRELIAPRMVSLLESAAAGRAG